MIDKFCEYLTNKIRKNMPEVDDERAEVIKYGLQLLVGEVPKIFIMMGIAWALGILKLTLICFCMIHILFLKGLMKTIFIYKNFRLHIV